nr:hypothetical protein [Tanacetum cinerariifolium]
MPEVKVDMGKALDDVLVVTESSRTESYKQDRSCISGNGITYAVDADIRPLYDQAPFTENDGGNAHIKRQTKRKLERLDQEVAVYHNGYDPLA